jgi:uncharacterized SAM-binding protein YcdF (DUF218 family)
MQKAGLSHTCATFAQGSRMHLLFSPLSWALLLPLVLVVGWRRLSRFLRAALLAVECALIVAMAPLGANALVWLVESRVPAAEACATSPSPIVVLAAGFEREPADAHDISALEADSIRRALAGAELWRKTPDVPLVLAGGGPYPVSENAVLMELMQQLGVPAQTIRGESHSQNTWENAEQLRALQPALPAQIRLVSSALHLPRALVAFRAAGFQPCAIASDRRYLPPGGVGYYLPQSSALRKAEFAIHELVGEAVYRWRAQ